MKPKRKKNTMFKSHEQQTKNKPATHTDEEREVDEKKTHNTSSSHLLIVLCKAVKME